MGFEPRGLLRVFCIFFLPALVGCGSSSDSAGPQQAPRPVTYMVLQETDPSRLTRLTGSVESWKREMLGFRVAGRVRRVAEPGVDIQGRVFDETGGLHSPGTAVAALDDDLYRLRVDEARARVKTAQAQAMATQVEIEQAIPEELKDAQAKLDYEQEQYRRAQVLVRSNTITPQEFERRVTALRSARARVAQVRAREATKTAELASLEAQSKEAEEMARQAEVDLADCQLYSPFRGQISKVHVIRGGYVEQGQPVVTVQMMDPVKVEIAVSPDTDRKLNYNDVVRVYPDESGEPIDGWVYLKDTVADAATRTFMVTMLVRNRQVEVGVPEKLQGKQFHRTPDVFKLVSELADGKAPFYTEQTSLQQDEQGYFVWKIVDRTISDLFERFDPVFRVQKVRVELGEKIIPLLQVSLYRELADLGGLDPQKDLVAGKLPKGVKDGDLVFLSRKQWLLRPGELVHVDLRGGSVSKGFYVPVQSILLKEGKHYVFIVDEGEGGEETGKRIEVKPGTIFGDFRLIEPAADGQLDVGTRLIVDGAHYLNGGDAVNAFDQLEVSL